MYMVLKDPFEIIYVSLCSGIKIFDIEKMIRIAHIDRPTGGETVLAYLLF